MAAAASRSTLNVPTRLTPITRANASRSCTPGRDRIRPAVPMPAQFTAIRSGAAGDRQIDGRLDVAVW